MTGTIRPPTAEDFSEWQTLWQAYLVFYQTKLPTETTTILWQRILDPQHRFQCLLAVESPDQSQAPGRIAGLVHFFPHEDTWEVHPVCYLQDLFVSPDLRRTGYGRALIEAVVVEAKNRGWTSVYWLTKHDNVTARKLYDALTGGTEGFVTYRMLPTMDA